MEDRTKRDSLLGLVFFVALGVLLWATMNLTDLWEDQRHQMVVRFPDASGLKAGDSVLLLGKKIGRVDQVDVEPAIPDFPIQVTMLVDRELEIRESARIVIREATLLGGMEVGIDPGSSGPPAPTPNRGRTRGNPLQSVGETFGGPDNQANMAGLLENARVFFENLNRPDSSIGALVTTDELYREMLAAVASVRRSAEAIERGQGAVGRLIHDPTVGQDIARTASNLRSITAKVDRGDGPIARLLNDADLGVMMGDIVDDVHELVRGVREGRGPLGRVLTDEEMAENLGAAVADLATLAARANDPEAGLLGAVLADAQLRRDVTGLAENLHRFAQALNEGGGVLPRAVHDEEWGERLDRILVQVSRGIEDAREAAPIGTFIQVLAGAF